MPVSSCPKCFDKITVPAGGAPEARVQCPLCSEEYLLGDVLDKLPPALIMLDAPAEAAAHVEAGSFAFDSGGEEAGGEYAVAEAEPSDTAPAFSFEDSSAPQTAPSPSFTATPRPKRRKKNPAIEIGKVVGGGVAGLVIAQLILWWLPQSIRKDPFKLGPKVSRFAPWIVPSTFRGNSAKKNKNDDSNDKDDQASLGNGKKNNNKTNNRQQSPNNNDTAKNNDPSLPIPIDQPDPSTPGVTIPTPDNPVPKPSVTPPPVSLPTTSDPKPVIPAPDLKPDIGKPTLPKVTIPPPDLKPDDVKPPAPAAVQVGIRNRQSSTSADLAAALGIANATLAIRDNALASASQDQPDSEQLREVNQALYRTLAQLGEKALVVDPADEGLASVIPDMHKLLKTLGEDPTAFAMLAELATQALIDKDNTETTGLVLAGTLLEDPQSDGKLYVSRIQLAGRKEALSVYGWVKPGNDLKKDVQVVFLGGQVADPVKNLIGYEGNARRVLCGSFYTIVPEKKPAAKDAPPSEPSSDEN